MIKMFDQSQKAPPKFKNQLYLNSQHPSKPPAHPSTSSFTSNQRQALYCGGVYVRPTQLDEARERRLSSQIGLSQKCTPVGQQQRKSVKRLKKKGSHSVKRQEAAGQGRQSAFIKQYQEQREERLAQTNLVEESLWQENCSLAEEGAVSYRGKEQQKHYETTFTPFQQYLVQNGQDAIQPQLAQENFVRKMTTLGLSKDPTLDQFQLPELGQPVKAVSSKFEIKSTSSEVAQKGVLQKKSLNVPAQQQQKQPQKRKEVFLSEADKHLYGNRTPAGYQKMNMIGKQLSTNITFRGGIALVWLGQKGGKQVAMKQFPKSNNQFDTSALIEVQVANLINAQAHLFAGSEHVAELLDFIEDKKDVWLIYELCRGRSLHESLFEVKGEFFKGERIYQVMHCPFYHALRTSPEVMKDFLQKMGSVLALFASIGMVHADLKPDNILVDFDEEEHKIASLKVIDFGSAFVLSERVEMKEQREFAMSTPEYLPPEIQTYMSRRFTQQTNFTIEDFTPISYIFDIWSLGSIMLEILSGIPLWLSLKSRVKSLDGKNIINYGLFGFSGRDNNKILQKQQQLFQNGMQSLRSALKKGFDWSGNALFEDQAFMDLLGRMLEMNPNKRISPSNMAKHRFFA